MKQNTSVLHFNALTMSTQAIICDHVYFAEGARKSNFASMVVLPKQFLYHIQLSSKVMVVFP